MENENIFTVSEINQHLKHIIEHNIPNLIIEGEIANFTRHNSGHIYFSLKDAKSSIRCVFFRSANLRLNFAPKVGDKVTCMGKITVFKRAGNYQLNVNKMSLSGVGDLQQKFEALKKKLEAEGLFDSFYKKNIPKFPEKIGVITSETGAVFQDIKNVISRRFPCKLILSPAVVQGKKAAITMIKALEYFNENKIVDLIILGRGGGSQEDLDCFNDEKLARSIYKSIIPIISAVGHEIDFTISDFVADLRAPTPSAAAELAVPDSIEIMKNLYSSFELLKNYSMKNILQKKLKINEIKNSLQRYHPEKKLNEIQQQCDEIQMRMKHSLAIYLQKKKKEIDLIKHSLKELSPYDILKRGYSLIRENTKILRSIHNLKENMDVEMILVDGKCNFTIKNLQKKQNK
ncbi:MAG: exodeoxyribonuclease VII large subunit [Candidatus Cloacimonetes bacterium]|nr:exodeoxyribonuclease VII large subunit [Candidatus Cloacimonadota bacterium]